MFSANVVVVAGASVPATQLGMMEDFGLAALHLEDGNDDIRVLERELEVVSARCKSSRSPFDRELRQAQIELTVAYLDLCAQQVAVANEAVLVLASERFREGRPVVVVPDCNLRGGLTLHGFLTGGWPNSEQYRVAQCSVRVRGVGQSRRPCPGVEVFCSVHESLDCDMPDASDVCSAEIVAAAREVLTPARMRSVASHGATVAPWWGCQPNYVSPAITVVSDDFGRSSFCVYVKLWAFVRA